MHTVWWRVKNVLYYVEYLEENHKFLTDLSRLKRSSEAFRNRLSGTSPSLLSLYSLNLQWKHSNVSVKGSIYKGVLMTIRLSRWLTNFLCDM